MKAITNFTTTNFKARIQLMLTIIGVVGIPAIILPFAYDYNPLAVAYNHDIPIWRLSWPFFLPIFITTAIIRWIILKKHSKAEIMLCYILSVAIICVTFSGYVARDGWTWTDDPLSQFAFIAPFVILLFGIFIVLRNRKKLIPKPSGAIVVMQVAYLINCVFCLIGFFGMWQISAYLSLATAIVYFAQLILFLENDKPDKFLHIL